VTGPLVAFYGDDLTGSTDTLSVLAEAGLAALLFLDLPTEADRQAAGALDALGVAGTTRMMSPAQMDDHLPDMFDALKATGARLVHYKICSTFDSSSAIGSIGHAIILARSRFRRGFVPVVVGQPSIGRYCAFGNLFAVASTGGTAYRLDRHPTMMRHPVTPMDEADLRFVLAAQGLQRVGLIEITRLRSGEAQGHLDCILGETPDAVLFDVLEEDDLQRIGQLIGARLASGEPVLGVGSSGLQQALLAGWDTLASRVGRRSPPVARRQETVLLISGSRSPVTAAQIEAAGAAGFALLALDPVRLINPDRAAETVAEAAAVAVCELSGGRSVVAHTSLGPDDPRGLVNTDRAALEKLAQACGLLARAVLERMPLRRLGICGGDTSSLAARALGVRALEYEYRLAPGVPVCRVRASGSRLDGVQVMLKGGQMGPGDVFARLAGGAVGTSGTT
jgi:uncharacterized protein YgbK (DUF1537 family)